MTITTMSVDPDSRTVSINGEGHTCNPDSFPALDPNIAALHWHPEKQGRCKGSVAYHQGPAHGIDAFTLLEPFVPAWEDAKERKQARTALIVAEAQGAFESPVAVESTPVPAPAADAPVLFPAPPAQPSSSVPAVSQAMMDRLAAHQARVDQTVHEASQLIAEAKANDRSEVEALKARIAGLESKLTDMSVMVKAAVEGKG